jgi:hypothetical protein
MVRSLTVHLRTNLVAYVALFAALGGTSYAAVRLSAGSVTSRALAKGAVTHSKLAANSVTSSTIRNGSLTSADFAKGMLSGKASSGTAGSAGSNGGKGPDGTSGPTGPTGPAGPAGPAGANGSSSIVTRAQGTGAVNAPHSASTAVPISNDTWTQAAGELDLITGTATLKTPSSCTGSFGNSLIVSVDGTPTTFAVGPTAPASTTVTMPFIVTPQMEPASSTSHHIAASFANSCTKDGEDYTVNNVRLDVIAFTS